MIIQDVAYGELGLDGDGPSLVDDLVWGDLEPRQETDADEEQGGLEPERSFESELIADRLGQHRTEDE